MRHLLVRLTALVLLAGLASDTIAGPTVDIPQASEDCAVSVLVDTSKTPNRIMLESGSFASGNNNLRSIWDVADKKQSPHRFLGAATYADITNANWLRLSLGNWWVGAGKGWNDTYSGNADAAQLWIDLHSKVPLQETYEPYAVLRKLRADWYGIGHSFPAHWNNLDGNMEIGIRRILAREYTEGVVEGSVTGEQFSGILRRISSISNGRAEEGKGWCVDADAEFRSRSWTFRAAVEGLFGKLKWDTLTVDDGSITSPGVFTDSEGFLRYVGGGISGLSWQITRSASINPVLRLACVRNSDPKLLMNATFREGDRALVGVGWAWPQKRDWMPYMRVYPKQRSLEAGIVSNCWRLRILADDWPMGAPKHFAAEASVCLTTR